MLSSRLILIIIFFFVIISESSAQQCDLMVKGFIVDEATNLPLPFANVLIQETSNGAITDDDGAFLIRNICAGKYHLSFSHIGCETKKIHLDVSRDTVLHIILPHSTKSLGTVFVKGKKENFSAQPSLSIKRQDIDDGSNKNFSDLLENELGVNLIKNGSSISKPVVHGLYGNRLIILNNGIIQSGQQWGNDHSPEIDPSVADKITVLKGANAIEYGGGNLGSLILVESKRIEREPHLHGQFNYVYETNGRGHTLNTRLDKYSPVIAWRINGALKKYGDKKTANYFLNNTGVEEANFSIQLEKAWKEKLFIDIYASTFNAQIGVLRGSHIGNLTDLEQALRREIPFFTEPDFSYAIDAPKQAVSHHLIKVKAKYFHKENQIFEFVAAGQLNKRNEFDVRRSGRTDIPALSLEQQTFNYDLKFTRKIKKWKYNCGIQSIATDNRNDPKTGILPLIPDYFSWKGGVYNTLYKEEGNTHLSIGVRYDYESQNVATISRTIPRKVVRFANEFHNATGLLAVKYNFSKTQFLSLNVGVTMRNPAINELYSAGLHQGVSGIEEGNINLKKERALKNTLEYKWLLSPNFSVGALAYHQHFKNYIFLNPQNQVRLTIRGAFPLFKYEQANANIYGLDIFTQFTVQNSIVGQLKYSYIRGQDTQNNIPLIFIPPNKFFASIVYRIKKTMRLSSGIIVEGLEFETNTKLMFEQKNILPTQDFVKPPRQYNLWGVKISNNVILPNYKFRIFAKAENLFNVQYRDYLNRQRYFADDAGISIILGVNFRF